LLDFEYFCRVKRCLHIVSFLIELAMLVACSKPAEVPEPVVAEPCRSVEGPTLVLSQIDTLMWHQPDSALAVMMEFAGSVAADSMDVFEGHYCQVLIAELLYKNYYKQSNRKNLLKAVHYFDSIVGMDGADTRGVSVQEREAFLAARAHYINGVGFYERDSLIEACGEYLNALRMMEGHFEEKVLVGHKARFMTLTYNRLGDLLSAQFMQEPAIYCCKKSLDYDRIAQASPDKIANTLLQLGKQFDKLKEYDSASYYYERILEIHPDNKTLLYRDAVCMLALSDYCAHHDTLASLDSLKRMVSQAVNEDERLGRFVGIGSIYQDMGQYDSAKVYLEPVLGKFGKKGKVAARLLRDIAMIEGDTVKANQYAQFLIEDVTSAANSQARVSQLNDMFQQHLQWEQERAEAERQQAARLRRNRMIVVVCALVVVAALLAWLLIRRKMKQQRDAASQQMEAVQEAHRLEKASMSGRLKKSNQELRELKDQMRQQAGNGAPKQEAQAVSFTDEPICRLIMERVNEGQFKAQMDCKLYQDYALGKEQVMALREAADRHFNQFTSRLAKAYPNLTKGDLDYCCLYLLGLSDADISALMQRAYATVSERSRKIKTIFGTEEPLSVALVSFANGSASI
jgi:tetratricopeptide (TPR) repeat protein